jgi:hypothetical protein
MFAMFFANIHFHKFQMQLLIYSNSEGPLPLMNTDYRNINAYFTLFDSYTDKIVKITLKGEFLSVLFPLNC